MRRISALVHRRLFIDRISFSNLKLGTFHHSSGCCRSIATSTTSTFASDMAFSHIQAGSSEVGSNLKSELRFGKSTYLNMSSTRDDLRRDIRNVTDNNISNSSQLDSFITLRLGECLVGNVAEIMRRSGKKTSRNLLKSLQSNLPAIAVRLQELSTESCWSPMNLAHIVYGLQCFGEEDENVVTILTIVAKKAEEMLEKKMKPQALDISMMLLGVQNNSCSDVNLQEFLVVLAKMIHKCSTPMKPQELGNIFYGLQSMRSSTTEVRNILTALHSKVTNFRGVLNAQETANIVYGLQGMDSKYPVVRAMVEAIIPHIRECSEPLSGQGVGNILYGMQRMGSDEEEVRGLLAVLLPMIRNCPETLRSQAVGNALYGLRRMTSSEGVVVALIQALTPIVENCTEEFNVQSIGNTMYGMRGFSSKVFEVRCLLRAFIPKIVNSNDVFTTKTVATVLYGMRSMTNEDSDEVRMLTGVIAEKIKFCKGYLGPQQVANSLYGLCGMSEQYPEISSILDTLGPMVDRCEEPLNSQEISNALYGLNRMHSWSPAVRRMLWALYPKVENFEGEFTAQEMGNAIYALRSMSAQHKEVLDILALLRVKLSQMTQPLDGQAITAAIFSMARHDCHHPEIRKFLKTLSEKLKTSLLVSNMSFYERTLSKRSVDAMDTTVPEVAAIWECLYTILKKEDKSTFEDEGDAALYGLLEGAMERENRRRFRGRD